MRSESFAFCSGESVHSTGIAFPGSLEPVRLLFVLLGPTDDPNLMLRILAVITRIVRKPQQISRLIGAETADEIYEILATPEERMPDFLLVRHLMNRSPIVLRETDTLGMAIEKFCLHNVMDLPIVSETGEVRGSIAIEDILRLAMPPHLPWLEAARAEAEAMRHAVWEVSGRG